MLQSLIVGPGVEIKADCKETDITVEEFRLKRVGLKNLSRQGL